MIYDVLYRGYVHVDRPEGGLPAVGAIQKAVRLLKEKHQKTARAMHPLFARGLDTPLTLCLSTVGLKVTLTPEAGKEAVVMNHPLHKVAYVLDMGTTVCFIVKRAGKGKFNCHGFEMSNAKNAHTIATKTAELCNDLFSKVRRVSHRVKRKSKVAGPKGGAGDVQLTSEMADSDGHAVQEAIREVEAGQDDSTPPTPSAAPVTAEGSVAVVDFIDELGDKLAQMVSGHDGGQEELALDLDNEMFMFGEVTGEMDC